MNPSPEEPFITNEPEDLSRTVFVTGSTSALGLRVIRRLTAEGWSPCCLLRSAEAERALFNFGVTSVVRGDCCSPASWEHTLQGIRTLLHLAPISLAPAVVEAAGRKGVGRFLAISSTRALSRLPNPLADAVRQGEAAVEASSLDFTILRSSMIYGAKQDANVDRVARWLDRRSWMPRVGGGTARIQPVHVDDVTDAVMRALNRPEATRRATLTVAGPVGLSWREMAETIASIKHRRIRWIPVPRKPAGMLARAAARFSPGFAGLPEVIQRMEEDRAFDISETIARLDGWKPMEFRVGAERTYGGHV